MTSGTYGYLQEPVRNESVLVGTSSVIIAEQRNEIAPRKVILIRNISPNVADIITINLGLTTASSDTGIVLKQGESFSDSSSSGYVAFQGTITAVCDTANGKLAVLER